MLIVRCPDVGFCRSFDQDLGFWRLLLLTSGFMHGTS
jgi:hypothetical protein